MSAFLLHGVAYVGCQPKNQAFAHHLERAGRPIGGLCRTDPHLWSAQKDRTQTHRCPIERNELRDHQGRGIWA